MHNAWKVLDLKFGAMRRPLLPSSDGFKNKGTLCPPFSVVKNIKFHKGCLLSVSY